MSLTGITLPSKTDIHALCGIRTHDLSRRAAVDLRLRLRGHWDRLICLIVTSVAKQCKRELTVAFPWHNFDVYLSFICKNHSGGMSCVKKSKDSKASLCYVIMRKFPIFRLRNSNPDILQAIQSVTRNTRAIVTEFVPWDKYCGLLRCCCCSILLGTIYSLSSYTVPLSDYFLCYLYHGFSSWWSRFLRHPSRQRACCILYPTYSFTFHTLFYIFLHYLLVTYYLHYDTRCRMYTTCSTNLWHLCYTFRL